MSSKRATLRMVVEWSPTSVSWLDDRHQLHTAASLKDAAGLLPSREVTVAVSRRSAFVRAYRVPNAGRTEVHRILTMQIGKLFPIPAGELAFDFHLTHDVSAEGRLAIVGAMRASDLESMHAQAKAAGIRIQQVTLACLGSAGIARAQGMQSAAVVQRSAEGLAVDLVVDGELRYSRLAPMPATSIAIEGEVSRTFAAAVLSCSPTIAAGGLALPDADSSTDRWDLEELAGNNVDIHIETEDQIARREKKAYVGRLRLSLVTVGCGAVLFTYQYLRWTDSQALFDKEQGKQSRQIKQRKDLLTGLTAKASSSTGVQGALDRAFHPAQTFADVLALASNDAPAGVWLSGLSVERGKPMTIRGTATKSEYIVAYQQALVAETRLRDVKLLFGTNTEIEKTPVIQFSISAFPVGNLPLAESEKKKVGAGQ